MKKQFLSSLLYLSLALSLPVFSADTTAAVTSAPVKRSCTTQPRPKRTLKKKGLLSRLKLWTKMGYKGGKLMLKKNWRKGKKNWIAFENNNPKKAAAAKLVALATAVIGGVVLVRKISGGTSDAPGNQKDA